MNNLPANALVMVCDKCLTACCWHGELMCDYAREAGEKQMTVKQLRDLGYEHESHWKYQEKVTGSPLKLSNANNYSDR